MNRGNSGLESPGNYGDPSTNNNESPRFLAPLVSGSAPKATANPRKHGDFSRNASSVFYSVVYDNFKVGDPIKIQWVANGRDFVLKDMEAGGDFGQLVAEFTKPDTGWELGNQEITASGKGASTRIVFTIGEGPSVGRLASGALTPAIAGSLAENNSIRGTGLKSTDFAGVETPVSVETTRIVNSRLPRLLPVPG